MKSNLEERFAMMLIFSGSDLPPHVTEHRFHPSRRWRFDFAWPKYNVAVEIDGGQWAPGGGRHAKDADRIKTNAAAEAGWIVLRFGAAQLQSSVACLAQLRAVLVARGWR